MGVVNTYRANIVEALKARFEGVVPTIEKHAGKFDIEEIKRLVATTPAMYVAVLGATHDTYLATGADAPCLIVGVFIFTEAEAGKDADDIGWDLAEKVFCIANQNTFESQVWTPKKMEIENLWTSNLDNLNACIMGVSWQAQTSLGRDLDASDMQVQDQTVSDQTVLVVNEDGSFGARRRPDMVEALPEPQRFP